MKYIDEFRDGELAIGIAARIAAEVRPDRTYRFMEFCGGHTHAIFRYGLPDLLPPSIRLVHGPGCPVCVLPMGRIDEAVEIASGRFGAPRDIIFAAYGDVLRVPGSGGASLLSARAGGADVRMVYSPLDALDLARSFPKREVIFFAIGFETTAPATALAVQEARACGLLNFSIFCNHVLTPPAIANILDAPKVRDLDGVPIDGFIGPAHVSTIIGTAPYEYFADEYGKPVVITGFEPLDVIQAILWLVRQVNDGRAEVENQYTRAVTREGNVKAQRLMAEIFELKKTFEWRGLGEIPYSGLRLKEAYSEFDAEKKFNMAPMRSLDNPACECGAILRGVKTPLDCALFGTVCSPETPIGACMVSSEGACAAYYTYGRRES